MFTSAYADVAADGSVGEQKSERDVLDAIAASCSLSNISVKMEDPVSKETKAIYSNGALLDPAWQVHVPSLGEPHNDVLILRLEKADGSRINPETKFTVTYDMSVDMDKVGVSLRSSDAYGGDKWMLTNNAKAQAPVGAAGGVLDLFTDGEYGPYDNYVDTSSSPTTLNCYAGAGAAAVYLNEPIDEKRQLSSTPDGYESRWLVTHYTGTAGKETASDVFFRDSLSWKAPDSLFSELDADKAAELKSALEGLLLQHTAYKDFTVRYGQESPVVVYESAGELEAPVSATTADGLHEMSLAPAGGSFTLELTDADLDNDLSAEYSVSLDWNAFFDEAVAKGHLLSNGNIAGTTKLFTASYSNAVADEEGRELAKGDSSDISIAMPSAKKTVVSSDGGEKVSWKVSADTGDVSTGKVTVTDFLSVTASSDDVKAAAEGSLSYSGVKVTVAGETAYDEAAEPPYIAPYGESNLVVSKSQGRLVVEVTSPDGTFAPGTPVEVEYDTVLDPTRYVELAAGATGGFSEDNSVQVDVGAASAEASASAEVTPEFPVTIAKERVDDGKATEASWKLTASSGSAGRGQIVIVDVPYAADDVLPYLAVSGFELELSGTGHDGKYGLDDLPDGVGVFADMDKNPLVIGKAGMSAFIVSVDDMPADALVTATYSLVLDRAGYLAAGGETGTAAEISNDAYLSTVDGYGAQASDDDSIDIPSSLEKDGEMSGYTDDGNPVFTWSIDVDLLADMDKAELDRLESVILEDDLHPFLSSRLESVKVYDISGDEPELLPAVGYEVATVGNKLTLKFSRPYEATKLRVVFDTEAIRTLDGISNTAVLTVGGKEYSSTENNPAHYTVKRQYGAIRSMADAKYAPTAKKYIDGQEISDEEHVFEFSATEVDANGKALEDGYTSVAQNTSDGSIVFDEVSYSSEGTHYYAMKETGAVSVKDDFDYDYAMDDRTFIVRVDVVASGNEYIASPTVISPANYDTVKFDNSRIKTRDLVVGKAWDDGDGKFRPASITVRLLNHGEPYDNMTATLNEANGWRHLFEGLPVADGEYSVEEVPVPGYEASYAGVAKDGDVWKAAVTNKAQEPGKLSVSKEIVGKDADPEEEFEFTITVGSDITGKFGDVELVAGIGKMKLRGGETAVLEDLPAGASYAVSEGMEDGWVQESAEGAEGIVTSGELATTAVFTNRFTATVSSSVEKRWEGDDEVMGDRPEAVVAVLMEKGADGYEPVAECELSRDNGWMATVDGLVKYDGDGELVARYWTEKTVPADYTMRISEEDGVSVITNEYTPGAPEVPVVKTAGRQLPITGEEGVVAVLALAGIAAVLLAALRLSSRKRS